jgi:hypothetical protein
MHTTAIECIYTFTGPRALSSVDSYYGVDFMKNVILATALTLAASVSASAGAIGEAKSPVSSGPDASTRLLVERFVDAYASHDANALARTVTKDFTARIYSTEAASGVAIAADSLARTWHQQVHALPSTYRDFDPVAIYPTPRSRTLFVAYRVAGQAGQHLALVEVRGHRVAQIKDFPGSSDSAPSGNSEPAVAAN